ncbi:MAG: O-antigen ligase family protein, partial [Xenococcus sp. MO_188.B8]|nr:O-antigen ligase family protein [Xenococcus sp. MO_188.B8]
MMRLNNQLLNLWVRNLEVVVTIILLLNFLGVTAPSPIPQLMKIVSYGIISILVILHWKRLFWIATRDIPLLLLVGTALASVFWSAELGSTLNACRGLLRTFLFGAYLATRYSIKEQMKILTWVFGIGAILSLVVALVIPSYGIASRVAIRGAFTGIFPYKNYLGYSMVLGAVIFLFTALQERKLSWLAWSGFCLTVTLTVLTKSSASLVCLLVLLSLMPIYQLIKLQYKTRVILVCLVCILLGSAAIIISGNLETILVDILGETTEFSGRTPIWTLTIEKVLEEQPWLGYGINAFWKTDAGSYVISNIWPLANLRDALLKQSFNFHSSYLAVFAGLGFLGLSWYAISLVTVFIRVVILLVSTKKILFFWCLQFLIFILIGGFADDIVSILNSSSYCAIYVSICLSTAVEYRRLRPFLKPT